ncbi:MAG: hypothetical protein ABH828_04420 [archaeon]
MHTHVHEEPRIFLDIDTSLSLAEIKENLQNSYKKISKIYGGEKNLPVSVVRSVQKAQDSLKTIKNSHTFDPEAYYAHATAEKTISIFSNTFRNRHGTGEYLSVKEYLKNV